MNSGNAHGTKVLTSHRTPLTLMIGPLEHILEKEGNLTLTDRDSLILVKRNSLRLLKLVNTLLDFSRIEAGFHFDFC